ncbi:MAG: histone deacetylase family protein [Pseudomonadota bacterium]
MTEPPSRTPDTTDASPGRYLLLRDGLFTGHDTGAEHPESPARLHALYASFDAHPEQLTAWQQASSRAATEAELALVHGPAHARRLEALATSIDDQAHYAYIDPDTRLAADSLSVARHAAGAVLTALDFVLAAPARRAFCAVRPPGHHAERADAMGFCLFNSIAVGAAAALAQRRVERVALLDFDVHHGNGTFDIFRDDPRVLVCSSFQHPFYPNRQLDLRAPHLRYTPLAAGTDGSAFRQAIERDWLPALAAHQPDLLLLSAGFDAHRDDPLAGLNLSTEDFKWLTALLVDQSESLCGGRLVSTLEGGYDLRALCDCVAVHLSALAGHAMSGLAPDT